MNLKYRKMTKRILLLLSLFAFIACSDDDFTENVEDPNDPENPIEEVEVGKKGAAYTNRRAGWSHKTSQLKVHWMYSWGNNMADEIPENVEFVPMFWGRGSVNQERIDYVKGLKNQGRINYVLGFNEPDNIPQANMTVEEAIERWPTLEGIGLPLGSPATVNPQNQWMQDFMAQAEQLDYRIDFINMHHYGGTSVSAFINKITTTFNDYGQRPIWIKEFAVADWEATSPSANRHSEQDVLVFMEEALNALEQIPYVHRYAWFDTGQNMPQLYTSSLFDSDENITAVGQLYSTIAPNDMIGPGMDTDVEPEVPETPEGEYFVNGGFETGDLLPWGGFKVEIAGPNQYPLSGNFCARLEPNDAALNYDLVNQLEPGETYILEYNFRWQEAPDQEMVGRIRDFGGDNDVLFTTEPLIGEPGEWTHGSLEFTMPDEFSDTIRIVFFKPQVNPSFPRMFFDDMSLRKVED